MRKTNTASLIILGLAVTLTITPSLFSDVFAEELDLNILDRFNPAPPGEISTSIGTFHVDEVGTIYLTTHAQGGVKVFDPNGNLLLFIDANDSEINSRSGLNAITVDNDGNIYVGEAIGSGRVLIFNPSGVLLDIIETGGVGGIEIADDGTLYVTSGNVVRSFDSDLNPIATFSSFGVIGLDNSGNVVVFDRFTETLTTFSSDGTVLDVLAIPTPPGFTTFIDVDIDENDNIFLLDKFSCLHMFDPTGLPLQKFCGDTEYQFGFYEFNFISTLEFGNGDHVYVHDGTEILELTFDNVWCDILEEEFDNVIIGTENDDVLKGTSGNDVIIGLGGNDNLVGKSGDDCILGGDGDDTIKGSRGDDRVDAGDGNDTVKGNKGNDTIFGSAGIDTILGGSGDDIIDGNENDDVLKGGNGNDTIFGGTGNDSIFGNKGSDVLKGNDDNDVVKGGSGDDTIFGNLGDDTLNGGKGTDACEEGFGSDTLIKCETVAPLTADLFSEIFLSSAVAGFPSSFEVETVNFGPDPIDNLIFSQILPNELEFNLDETIDNNDSEYDLEFQTIPVGATSYELKIIVTSEIIIPYVTIEVSIDVASDAQPQTIFVTSTVTTIHPNFVDPNESNNSSTEELDILVFP